MTALYRGGRKDYKPFLAKGYVACVVLNGESGFQEDVVMWKLKFGELLLAREELDTKVFSVLLSLLFSILGHLNGRQVCYRNVQRTYMHSPKCHIAVQYILPL